MKLELLVTLWPTFPHFKRFATDSRVSGIRLNSAMIKLAELDREFEEAKRNESVPLWFDVKGRQLRVTEVFPYKDHLELELNHPIDVQTPTPVLFKAGADHALLEKVAGKRHLIFNGGPEYMVYAGESIHIRHPSLVVYGPTFLNSEIEKIKKARSAGFDRFFLSYVESQRDIDEFREFVGDSQIMAKIENKKGLEYVAKEFRKKPNLSLMAARGDLYVEVDKPHHILEALKLIVKKDPEAGVGSRLLLSTINKPVPECADFMDLAWLYDIGYRKMMLCDEICLKEELLARAINAFESFRGGYAKTNADCYKPKYILNMVGLKGRGREAVYHSYNLAEK
ncbi:MAG TPA: pyruvate kinase [Candidatus Nanoarchaeia archaeon]|nr:pyruvate kinase [Candidatus Nanoarchaeia archaeon]